MTTGPFKSMQLAEWAEVLGAPNTRFVSLQYDANGEEIDAARTATGADIVHDVSIAPTADLEQFASQISAMDLIISGSNTTVHMAGALGKPTWLLAPTGQGLHWYWFKNRPNSPWYPSLRIFRQKTPGVWNDVFRQVATALHDWNRT